MPIKGDLIGGSILRCLDDLDPKVVLPTMDADLGERHARCDEVIGSLGIVIGVDSLTDEYRVWFEQEVVGL